MKQDEQVEKAIKVKRLHKSYKQVQVLNGVDFDVEQGSIFALLGSNGAGKTTIIKILTTLLKQDAGTAREKSGLSQSEVAQKAHVTQQQLSKIENGKNCNMVTFLKVCNALNLDLNFSEQNIAI